MAKKTITDGQSGLEIRTILNENFTELFDKDLSLVQLVAGKAPITHFHAGVYEPADPLIQEHLANPHNYEPANVNIQAHIATPHAPSNANFYEHPDTHPLSMISGAGSAAGKDTGVEGGHVVLLEAGGKLPAIDGSQLVNVTSLTEDQQAAVEGANAPSAANPFATIEDVGEGGGGGLDPAVYDPDTIAGDVFDMDNMKDGDTLVAMTVEERAAIEANSNKTGITYDQAVIVADASTHMTNDDNPHATTKSHVGLANVDNTSDLSKPISTATQSALDLKASSTHNHDLVYEPKDPAIQEHITSLHADPLAQANADITKEEIELKLIGDNIASHRHEHRTNLSDSAGDTAGLYARRDQTLSEASTGNAWGEDGVVITNNTTNKSAQVKVTIDPDRNLPIIKSRVSGLGAEEIIEDSFTADADTYESLDPILWTQIGTWTNCGQMSYGLHMVPTNTDDPAFYSNFFWTPDANIDIQWEMRCLDNVNNSGTAVGLAWDTEDLATTPRSDDSDMVANFYNYDDNLTPRVYTSASGSNSTNIYDFFPDYETFRFLRIKRTVTAEMTYTYELLTSSDGVAWSTRMINTDNVWYGDGNNSYNTHFKFSAYYYSTTSRTEFDVRNFVDNIGTATFSADTSWSEWGGTADTLINYDVANITTTADPTSYPLGLSIVNFDDKALGFPAWRGSLITQKHSDTRATQLLQSSGDGKIYTRNHEYWLQAPESEYSDLTFENKTELDPYIWNLSYTLWDIESWIENDWLYLSRQPSFGYSTSSYRNELGIDYIPGIGQEWSVETQFDLSQLDYDTIDDHFEAYFVLGISRDESLFEESGTAYYRAVWRIDIGADTLEFSTDNTLRGSVSNWSTIRSGFVKTYRVGTTLYGAWKQNEEDAWTVIGSGAETYADNGCRIWFGFVGTYQYARNIHRSIAKHKYFKFTNTDLDGHLTAAMWTEWKEHINFDSASAEAGDTLVYNGSSFEPQSIGQMYTKTKSLDQGDILQIVHKDDPNIERNIKILEQRTGSLAQVSTAIDFSVLGDYEQKSYFYPSYFAVSESLGDVTIQTNSYGWYPPGLTYVSSPSFTDFDTGVIYGTYINDAGTKVYACHNITTIGQWTLSTPFDWSTAVYDGTGLFTNPSSHGSNSIWFKPDGTKCYCIRTDAIHFDEYDLNVAWDITAGVTYVASSPYDHTWEGNSYGIKVCISADGMHLYMHSQYSEWRYYRFNVAWDVTSLTYVCQLDEDNSLMELPYAVYAVGVDPEGHYAYVAGSYADYQPYDGIFRWKMHTPFDLSTARENDYIRWDWEDTVSGNFPLTSGASWTPNGKYFLSSGSTGNGKLYSMFNNGIRPNIPHLITTSGVTSFPISKVKTINSLTVTSTTPANTEIWMLTSFDGGETWNRLQGSTWFPVNEIDFFINISGNTIAEIEAVFTLFVVSDEQSLDFAFGLVSTDGIATPTLSGVSIDYDESDSFYMALDSDYDVSVATGATLIEKISAGSETVKAVINIGSGESLSPDSSLTGTAEVTREAIEKVLVGDITTHTHSALDKSTAADITIADVAGNFASENVEAALIELVEASGTGVPISAGVVYHGTIDPESVSDINLLTATRGSDYGVSGGYQTRIWFPPESFATDQSGSMVLKFYCNTTGVTISSLGCACPNDIVTATHVTDPTKSYATDIRFAGGAASVLTTAGVQIETDPFDFPEQVHITGLIVTIYNDILVRPYVDTANTGYTFFSNQQTDITDPFIQSSGYGSPMWVDSIERVDYVIGQDDDIYINMTSKAIFLKESSVWNEVGSFSGGVTIDDVIATTIALG